MNSDFEMSIEDVQEALEVENKRERIEVPAGEYVCVALLVLCRLGCPCRHI